MSKNAQTLKRIAILMMTIEMESPGASKRVFDLIGEDMAKNILHEMSDLDVIDAEECNEVVDEFHAIMQGDKSFFGGKTIPNAIYKSTFKEKTGKQLFEKKNQLFGFLKRLSEPQLKKFLAQESPQLAAAMLNFMDEDTVANILSKLPKEQVILISERLIKLEVPSMRLMWQLHQHFTTVFEKERQEARTKDSPVEKLARSFELMADDDRTDILTYFDRSQKAIATEIKAKMLTFDDLVQLPQEDLQTILYEIQSIPDLALALVASTQETKNLIRKNISLRLQSILDEEMGLIKEPKPEAIQKAQQTVLSLARQLEKAGKINSLSELKRQAAQLSANEDERKEDMNND